MAEVGRRRRLSAADGVLAAPCGAEGRRGGRRARAVERERERRRAGKERRMSEQDPKRLLEGGAPGACARCSRPDASEVPDNARLAMLALKMGIVAGWAARARPARRVPVAQAARGRGRPQGPAARARWAAAKAVATAGAAIKAGMAVR